MPSGLAYLGIAARALLGNPFRSALTVLSITLGAFAIVLMSSLAESGLTTLRSGLEELGGARLLMIVPQEPVRAEGKIGSFRRGFTRAERDWLFADVPHVAELSFYAALGPKDVGDNETVARTDLIAADSRFLEAYRMRIVHGRAFTEDENREHAKVCVVGHKLAQKVWETSPIGHKLTIGALRCRVIGELADSDRLGVSFGFDWIDLVIVPRETAAETEAAIPAESMFLIKTDDARDNEVVKRILNARLGSRHHGIDDFTIYDFAAILEKFAAVFVIMEAIVGFIAGIALVIGGVGVMNMMLVSVSERVREIGIRKALGATPADIRSQFLAEALLLAGVGGLVGVASGALAAVGASALIHTALPTWIGTVSTPAATAAMTVSLGVGLVFGYFPARRAGRLDPIQAMRR
jgi:putative ABC transport system permease protein